MVLSSVFTWTCEYYCYGCALVTLHYRSEISEPPNTEFGKFLRIVRFSGPFSRFQCGLQDGMQGNATFSSGSFFTNSQNRLPLCHDHSIRIIHRVKFLLFSPLNMQQYEKLTFVRIYFSTRLSDNFHPDCLSNESIACLETL